jgi:hypothetical protein
MGQILSDKKYRMQSNGNQVSANQECDFLIAFAMGAQEGVRA